MNWEFTIQAARIRHIYGLNVQIKWAVGNFLTICLKMRELSALRERALENVAKTISE